jgi:Ca2+-binding EF-hand superfamily protein
MPLLSLAKRKHKMSDIFDKIASDFKSNRKSSFLTQPLRTRYDYGERVSSSFNDLDQDNDGKISPSEWEEGFDMIDRDDSGFISDDEWDNPNFDGVDQDDDGLISRDEWAEGFDEIDEDDDGLISEEEFYSRKANELNEMDDIIDDLQDDLEEVEDIVDDLQVDEDFSSRFVEDFDSEITVSKSARFHAGPEGRKEWEEWKENNPNAADEFDAQTEANKDVVKGLVRGKKAHRHHGSYMSLQNIKEMSEFLYTLEDQVHEGEELEDWVEDKISHAHATLSDLHRFFGFGGGYHTHDDK